MRNNFRDKITVLENLWVGISPISGPACPVHRCIVDSALCFNLSVLLYGGSDVLFFFFLFPLKMLKILCFLGV